MIKVKMGRFFRRRLMGLSVPQVRARYLGANLGSALYAGAPQVQDGCHIQARLWLEWVNSR